MILKFLRGNTHKRRGIDSGGVIRSSSGKGLYRKQNLIYHDVGVSLQEDVDQWQGLK